jgi:hypothetical protein
LATRLPEIASQILAADASGIDVKAHATAATRAADARPTARPVLVGLNIADLPLEVTHRDFPPNKERVNISNDICRERHAAKGVIRNGINHAKGTRENKVKKLLI